MAQMPKPVTDTEWMQAVDDLLASARSSGTVHRPLLLLYLLGRAQRNLPRDVPFSEVDSALQRALGVAVTAKRVEPLLPFWHLRNSAFWIVYNDDSFPRRRGKDRPTRSALVAGSAVGAIRVEWWTALTNSPALVTALVRRILLSIPIEPSIQASIVDVLQIRP